MRLRSYFRNTIHFVPYPLRPSRKMSTPVTRRRDFTCASTSSASYRSSCTPTRARVHVQPRDQVQHVCGHGPGRAHDASSQPSLLPWPSPLLLLSSSRSPAPSFSHSPRSSIRDWSACRVPTFIVERGVVAKRGKLGLSGCCFGKDVILSNDNLRDLGDAIALTFVQVISLSQADIFSLLPEFPRAYHVIRKAALRMALVYAVIRAAQIVKRARRELAESDLADMDITDMFDIALKEADMVKKRRIENEERKSAREQVLPPITLKVCTQAPPGDVACTLSLALASTYHP